MYNFSLFRENPDLINIQDDLKYDWNHHRLSVQLPRPIPIHSRPFINISIGFTGNVLFEPLFREDHNHSEIIAPFWGKFRFDQGNFSCNRIQISNHIFFFQFYSGKVLYHLRQHAIEIRWLNMSHSSLEVSESNHFDFGLVIFTTGYMKFLYEKIPDWHSELMKNNELRIGILEYPQ